MPLLRLLGPILLHHSYPLARYSSHGGDSPPFKIRSHGNINKDQIIRAGDFIFMRLLVKTNIKELLKYEIFSPIGTPYRTSRTWSMGSRNIEHARKSTTLTPVELDLCHSHEHYLIAFVKSSSNFVTLTPLLRLPEHIMSSTSFSRPTKTLGLVVFRSRP